MSEQVAGGAAAGAPSPYRIQVSYGAGGSTQSGGIARGTGADWFGPLNPLTPIAPADVAGRRFDFPVGYNLNIRPRAGELTGFQELRAFADAYDLLRLVIETRKDQMERQRWRIRPRAAKSARRSGARDAELAARIAAIESFFQKPDGVTRWKTWLRAVLEDMFVIDAATLYCQRTRSGQLCATCADRRRHHQAGDRRLGPHAAALSRRGRRHRLSAGLSAGAQRPAGRQLLGARHHLPAAQCARPQGVRLFAGAAGADDGQHRAAPADVAARLLHRGLDPGCADRRAERLDAGADQTVSGLLGYRARRRPRETPPRQVRARRQREPRAPDQGAGPQGRISTNGSRASSALRFRCRRNGR